MAPTAGRVTGLALPPIHLLVLLAAFSLLASVARVNLTGSARAPLGASTLILTGLLISIATSSGYAFDDHRWIFYRGWGTGVYTLSRASILLVAAGVTIAVLVSRRRPGWVAPTLVTALPWLYFWTLFATGTNTASRRLPALAVIGLTGCAAIALLGYRIGRRAIARD